MKSVHARRTHTHSPTHTHTRPKRDHDQIIAVAAAAAAACLDNLSRKKTFIKDGSTLPEQFSFFLFYRKPRNFLHSTYSYLWLNAQSHHSRLDRLSNGTALFDVFYFFFVSLEHSVQTSRTPQHRHRQWLNWKHKMAFAVRESRDLRFFIGHKLINRSHIYAATNGWKFQLHRKDAVGLLPVPIPWDNYSKYFATVPTLKCASRIGKLGSSTKSGDRKCVASVEIEWINIFHSIEHVAENSLEKRYHAMHRTIDGKWYCSQFKIVHGIFQFCWFLELTRWRKSETTFYGI